MGLQPNLASRPDVVSGAVPQKFGAQKNIKFWTTFCDFRIRHRISPERNVISTNKNASVNIRCVLKR